MKIDFHTHCFPERIAARTIEKLSYGSGGMIPQSDGTKDGLKSVMQQDGVDISIIASIATNEKQMTAVNDFAKSIECESIVPFGSVYPKAESALYEIERIHALGLKGVKFHPDYQGFYVDEAFMKPIYKKIGELGLVTLFHAGQDIGFAAPFHGMPEQFARALSMFDSPVVLAHWGGAFVPEQVLNYLAGLPVYFDTSFGYGTAPKAYLQRIYEKHGADRLLFASDMPWQRPAWAEALLKSLDIPVEDLEKIYHKNAERLLNLK